MLVSNAIHSHRPVFASRYDSRELAVTLHQLHVFLYAVCLGTS